MAQSRIPQDAVNSIQVLFKERVKLTPDKIAYRQFDAVSQSWHGSSWSQMASEVARWQAALEKEGLQPGDRVALMLQNSRDWVVFDQAAVGLGLVTVPLYFDDRADNVAYIINNADVKFLLLYEYQQWLHISECDVDLDGLKRVICIQPIEELNTDKQNQRLLGLSEWLFGVAGELKIFDNEPDDLATIVYTSGTTGRPKGVMLSHKNILTNAYASTQCADVDEDDIFLSFLPLSHSLERSIGYYFPMIMAAEVVYARSVQQLGEDLIAIRPTVLISVPRIYERVYGKIKDGLKEKSPIARKLFHLAVDVGWARFEHQQGRGAWNLSILFWPLLNKLVASKVMEKLGGHLRIAICGGAALSPEVAHLFIGLGLPLLQGYGLTETSPVISVNRANDNIPASIGAVLPGVKVRIGKDDELQTNSDCVMLGYWKNDQATQESMTEDGWLRTGDQARIDEDKHIYITGRLKEIIVLANGEKMPPNDMEMSIALDGLIEQVMVVGEARPYLTALLMLEAEHWRSLASELGLDAQDPASLKSKLLHDVVLKRVAQGLRQFPGYAQIRRISIYLEPWAIENGLLTPTLKVKRAKVLERFAEDITHMYEGHS